MAARAESPPPASRAASRAVGLAAALAIVAFNAAWVAAALGPLHRPRQVLETDHWHYIEMARGMARQLEREARGASAEGLPPGAGVRPELALRAPYCWRVLVPGTVALLMRAGVSLHLAFYLLTNAALVAFLYVLFVSLESFGFDLRLRLFGLALCGLTQGAVRWFEYQYWMTDPEGLLLVALGVHWARRERLAPLAALGLLAAFLRETFVIVYPFAFLVLLHRRGLAKALGATAALAAGPLVVTLALRHLIVPAVHPGLVDSIVDNLGFRLNHLWDNQPYVLTLGAWGVLLPLALLFPRRLLDYARRHPEDLSLLAFVYATTVLISNNNERPLAYALPAVLPAALKGLEWLIAAARLPAGAVIGAALAAQALFYVRTKFTGLGISTYQPVSWAVVMAMAAFWIAAVVLARARGGTGRGAGAA